MLLLVAVSISVRAAAGQSCAVPLDQFSVRSWQVEHGLPLDSVHALTQTPDGFLWVGTEDGLARFDGKSFERLDLSVQLADAPEFIQSLGSDGDGNVLVGTATSGVLEIRGGRPDAVESVFSDETSVFAVLVSGADEAWAGTRGSGLVHRRNRSETLASPARPQPGSTVQALAPRSDGGIWVGYEGNGLAFFDGDQFHRIEAEERLAELFVSGLAESSAGTLWIAAREGLFRWDGASLDDLGPELGLGEDVYPQALLEDRSGAVWIGTAGGGLLRYCHGRIERLTAENGLPSDSVWELLQDTEGSIWLATGGGGLVQLVVGAAVPFGPDQGLPDAPVLPVMEASDGAMWFGTFGGGVVRMEGDRIRTWNVADGLSSSRVLSLAEGAGGKIWVGTREGLNRIGADGVVERVDAEGDLPHPTVASLLQHEGRLWIGTIAGLSALEDGRFQAYEPESGPFDAYIVSLWMDREGMLWIGTDGRGVFQLAGGQVREAPFNDQVPRPAAMGFLELRPGIVWIATSRGLVRWDGEQAQVISASHGLPDPQIFALLADGLGGIWMSGNRGVFRVDEQALEDVAAGTAQRLEVQGFGREDGMPGTETNGGFQPAGWRGEDGSLWFPTLRGAARFDPARVTRPQPPRVSIQRIRVGEDTVIQAHGTLRIGSRPSWVEFAYAAPTFLRPHQMEFEHRLEGLDMEWYRTGERQALFRRPPPGNFRFEVRVRESGGSWSEPVSLELMVQRHLLEQPWLWITLALLAALGLWWGSRRRMLSRIRFEQQLQRSQKMEAVGLLAGGVAHDFNNMLAAIMHGTEALAERMPNDPGARKDAEAVLDAAERGAALTRQLLAFARRQPGAPRWVDLVSELEGIRGFVRRVIPSMHELEWDVRPDTGVCHIDPVQFQQVVLNLTTNARDAMPGGGTIHIEAGPCSANDLPEALQPNGQQWARIRVRDQGVGMSPETLQRLFEPFYTTKDERHGTGLGLAVTYGIVREAGGLISVESTLGEGSCFDVFLPTRPTPPGASPF